MNTQLLSVARTGGRDRPRPRIAFTGDWLPEIGFVPGALVQTLPAQGGVDIILCDEGTPRYSELFHRTKELGGGLTRVFYSDSVGRRGPTYTTSGRYILGGGLAIGDTLIARYEPGIIQVRKVDPEKLGFENLRIVTVTHIKRGYGSGLIPKIRLSGYWMGDFGFTVGSVLIAEAGGGFITLDLAESQADYGSVTKYARARGMKVVQVSKDPHGKEIPLPCIGITGSLITRSGFSIGDTLACSYEYGRIKFQRLGFDKLGFC